MSSRPDPQTTPTAHQPSPINRSIALLTTITVAMMLILVGLNSPVFNTKSALLRESAATDVTYDDTYADGGRKFHTGKLSADGGGGGRLGRAPRRFKEAQREDNVSSGRRRPPAMRSPKPVKKQADKNAYYGTRHVGGTGHLAHTRKLIRSGIQVGNQTIRLESFVKSYRQNLPAPTSGSVGVSLALDHGLQPSQGGIAYLQVALKGTPKTPEKRLPLNVHLVLDRSGSMQSGGKMTQAKLAAKEVVRQLAQHDIFSLVIYDNEVEVLVPAGTVKNKTQLYKTIDGITPRGSTNIYGALETAYDQERKFHSDEFLNLVLLVSDGKANVGPRTPGLIGGLSAKAFARGVQTTSVGMGLDYNEQVMIAIAEKGHGNYHFIEESESVAALLRKEFEELGRTVAMALQTRIVLAPEVKLYRVLGFEKLGQQAVAQIKREERKIDNKLADKYGIKTNRSKKDEPGIKFYRTTLRKNEAQIYLLEIGLPPGSKPREIATIHFKYKDMVKLGNRRIERTASCRYSDDSVKRKASLSRPVMKNQLGFETGYTLRKAAHLISRGETSGAYRVIAKQQRLVKQVGTSWSDSHLLRDAELLGRYATILAPLQGKDIRRSSVGMYLMKTFSYEGFRLSH